MNNHISIRLENYNTVSSWLIRLGDKNNFNFSLIKWLDYEYVKYVRNYPNICIRIQITFDDTAYLYPLIVNKPCKIEPINNLSQSLNSTDLDDLEDLEDLEDYFPPSKKLKRANAVITLYACDIVELDTILKHIFSNFL
jgi:hypothetical protein